jgi:MFS family permease
MEKKSSSKTQLSAWCIWFSAALFYAYEFYLRVTPTVLYADLIRDFSINAAEIGLLSAAYYYAYAIMQIPVGLLFDRYSVRKLLLGAALLVTFSCFMMAYTPYFILAILSRIAMGAGSAFAFIGCIKLAKSWFSAQYLPIIIGLTNSFGIAGAIGSATPLALLLNQLSWRQTLYLSGVLGLGLVALLFITVKDATQTSPRNRTNRTTLKTILTDPKTLLTALYGGLLVAPIAVFTELFAIQFLLDSYQLDRLHAANLTACTFLGIGLGGPIFGALTASFGRRQLIMTTATLLALACFAAIIYLPGLSLFNLTGLFFGFGFFTSHMLLIFAINTERHPPYAAATVIGICNTIVMLGGTFFQPLIGWFFDHAATASSLQPSGEYGLAFLLLVACQLLALCLIPTITAKP